MSEDKTIVQQFRGTTAQHSNYVGPEGQITVDTDKDTVVVQDGVTIGGHPLAKEERRVEGDGVYIKGGAAIL